MVSHPPFSNPIVQFVNFWAPIILATTGILNSVRRKGGDITFYLKKHAYIKILEDLYYSSLYYCDVIIT